MRFPSTVFLKKNGNGWAHNIESVTKLLKCNVFAQVNYQKIGNFLYFSFFFKCAYIIFNNSGNINHQNAQKHIPKVLKIAKARCIWLVVVYDNLPWIFLHNGLCVRKAKMPENKISKKFSDGTGAARADEDWAGTFSEWIKCQLRNECLFFWVHGEWIVARDKQIAWTAKRFSDDLFVPRYDSFPPWTQKNRHSFLIFTMFPTSTLSKILREKL